MHPISLMNVYSVPLHSFGVGRNDRWHLELLRVSDRTDVMRCHISSPQCEVKAETLIAVNEGGKSYSFTPIAEHCPAPKKLGMSYEDLIRKLLNAETAARAARLLQVRITD